MIHGGALFRHLQELCVTRNVFFGKLSADGIGDMLQIVCGQCEDRRARTREADTQQTGVGGWCDRSQNTRQAWDQVLPVRLVNTCLLYTSDAADE